MTPKSRLTSSASRELLVAALLVSEHLHPAGRADQVRRSGFLGQRHMLGDAALDERRVHPRDRLVLGRTRMHPVLPQEGGELRDGGPVVMGVDGVVEGIAQQRAEIVRETVRIDAFALDQARIAEGGFLAGLALVDQQDRAAALLQMQGNRHADDAGSKNNHILTHEGPAPFPVASPKESGHILAKGPSLLLLARRRPWLSRRKFGSPQGSGLELVRAGGSLPVAVANGSCYRARP